ncbi:hypothetical protein H634G_11727, partial [Metarhizium anisopliae BRIP 53293]
SYWTFRATVVTQDKVSLDKVSPDFQAHSRVCKGGLGDVEGSGLDLFYLEDMEVYI